MQVATLFRETATLLGASMEPGGGLQDVQGMPMGMNSNENMPVLDTQMHHPYKMWDIFVYNLSYTLYINCHYVIAPNCVDIAHTDKQKLI